MDEKNSLNKARDYEKDDQNNEGEGTSYERENESYKGNLEEEKGNKDEKETKLTNSCKIISISFHSHCFHKDKTINEKLKELSLSIQAEAKSLLKSSKKINLGFEEDFKEIIKIFDDYLGEDLEKAIEMVKGLETDINRL